MPLLIQQLRKERDMTQEEFAELCGISRSSLARYESGAPMRRDCLVKIATACGISVEDILGTKKAAQQELDGQIEKFVTGAQRLSQDGREKLASYMDFLLAQEQQARPALSAVPQDSDA